MNQEQLKVTVTGLDLGSGYAKLAAVDKGSVDIITNEANLRQTPTLVAYGQNERLLGESAQAKIKSNYANTISAPQRYLGFSQSEYTLNQSKLAPCKPKQEDGVLYFGVSQQEKKQKLSAQQVTAAFLTKINQIVEMNKLNNKYLVVAVPDYLTHHERKAMLNAIHIARENSQVNYGVQLINESAAIGLDYGFYKKNDFKDKEQEGQVTLFIDFGHSKLSAYAIRFTKKYQKVVLQHHKRQLGCRNLDALMYQFYEDMFQSQNTDLQIGVGESKKAILKLMQNIEKQRKVLSGNSEYDFNIECLMEERDISYTMSRNQFEQISEPVLQEIANFFEQVKNKLNQMGVSPASIELIGGGSRIPCFIKTVSNVFGLEPSRTLNSSECIARGAALYSAMQSSLFRTQPYYSVELSPYDLRCSWKSQGQTMQIQQNNAVILQRSQPLFSEKEITLDLKAASKKMFLEISDSNIPAGLQNKICSFWVEFEEWNPQQTEKQVKLTLKFDDNKLINSLSMVEIKDKQSVLKLSELTFVERLSQEKLKEFIAKEKQDIAKDYQIIANYERKNNFESKIYAMKQSVVNLADNSMMKEFVRAERVEEVFKFFNELEDNLQKVLNFDQEIKKAQQVVKQFETEVESTKNRYLKVEEQLKKFNEYIEAVVNGKVKQIKFYPGEEVQRMKNWIASTLSQLRRLPKNGQLCTNLQEISNMRKVLNEKIDQCQAEELKRQKQKEKRYYQTRQSQNRQFYRDPYQTSPFGAHYGYEGPRTRQRGRNTSFGGGFNPFNSFSGFF